MKDIDYRDYATDELPHEETFELPGNRKARRDLKRKNKGFRRNTARNSHRPKKVAR